MSSAPRNRWVEIEQVGDVSVVKFTRSEFLDDAAIEAVGDQLFAHVDRLGVRQMVLNFHGVERMASLMLGKIMSLHRKLKAVGGRLVLCGVDPQIYWVFETLRLPKLLAFCKDEQEALQAF
jgi:anti-sigma B factor antagonist